MPITDKYRRQIAEALPVDYNGLEFHPLTVRDYETYLLGKKPFELMLSSLGDPKLARLSWCACLAAIDLRFQQQTEQMGLYLVSVMRVMDAALRLGVADGSGSGDIVPCFTKDGQLTAISIQETGQTPIFLNMQQMDDVRQIIAAQNGYKIPDENWNPELVKAAQMNAEDSGKGIEYDRDTLICSVAAQYRCRPKEIYDWTIKEFMDVQEAIDRAMGYQIYTLAETAGWVTFKNGNPYPTWKFNRTADMPMGFRTIADIEAGANGLIAGT